MRYFIGLTFYPNYLQFKKIDSFRRRFDWKYERSNVLQMTILPPFQLNFSNQKALGGFTDTLVEEMETHLMGLEGPLEVDFNGFDFRQGRKGVIYLKPDLPIDIFHSMENLEEVVKEFGGKLKKRKSPGGGSLQLDKPFLPVGRFQENLLLGAAVETARIEFTNPFQLMARDITLFEKVPGQWIQKRKLFTFDAATDGMSGETDFSQFKSPAC
mgnify:CR=1 FL=1|tara:strand:+ start:12254 stop:12892 length:639 start_codon:yes stop_codon:yes gene_type:complete